VQCRWQPDYASASILAALRLEAAAVGRTGAVCVRRRIATPKGNYRATIEAITALVSAIELQIGEIVPVGIGIPGTISPIRGLVKNANSTWLIGRPLQQDLETAFGWPTRLANDANCFALSEATDGAAVGMQTIFGVILGTGIGGGIAQGGRILLGANAIAGEWGHNPLPWPTPGEIPGPACYCGRSGCIETFSPGPRLRQIIVVTGDEACVQLRSPPLPRAAMRNVPRASDAIWTV